MIDAYSSHLIIDSKIRLPKVVSRFINHFTKNIPLRIKNIPATARGYYYTRFSTGNKQVYFNRKQFKTNLLAAP